MIQHMKQLNTLDNPLHFWLDLIRRNSFKLTKHFQMFFCSELLPQNIKLGTYPNFLGYIFFTRVVTLDIDITFIAA